MNKHLSTFSKYLTAAFIVLIALGNSTDPPNGRTGAPGDGVCSSCHSGNNFEGKISIDGLPDMAISGESYTIAVTVKNTDAKAIRAGFQMVSLFNDGNFNNAGDYSPNSADEGISVAGGRKYIEHRGAKNFQDSIAEWIFEWEAPLVDSEREVVMFAAGNIANGSGSSGDAIKFTDKAFLVQPASLESIEVTISSDGIDCNGGNGDLIANASGGSDDFTYLWSNGVNTRENLSLTIGSYTVTVTDTNDSIAVATFNLVQPEPFTFNLTVKDESASNAMDGEIVAEVSGGTAPYSYLWSNNATTSVISNLEPGSYSLIVEDANGCMDTVHTQVANAACLFDVNLNFSNITCAGADDGEATIDPANFLQPLTFEWSNGENTFIAIAGLSPGNYAVTVEDGSGCTTVEEFKIIEPEALQISLIPSFPDCTDPSNNSLLALATGGSGNYDYSWSGGQTTAELEGLTDGFYRVTVTDEQGCEETNEIEFGFADSELPVITFTDSISLYVDSSGLVDFGPLNISQTDNCGVLSAQFGGEVHCDNIGPRTYTYFVTDVNGNEATAEIYVTSIIDTIAPQILSCVEDIIQDGCDTIFYELPEVLDNCGVDRMELAEGLPSGSVFPKDSTKVTYNYYDATGNFACCTFWVVTNNDLTLNVDEVSDATAGEGGEIAITAGGGTGNYTYEWIFNDSLVVSNFEDVTGLNPGSYIVSVRDDSGCYIVSQAILIEMSSAIQEESIVDLNLAPNPVENLLSIDASEIIVSVRIFSVDGQFISQRTNSPSQKSMILSVSDYEKGLYFLEVHYEQGTSVSKFIKN